MPDSPDIAKCPKCGAPVQGGRFCEMCGEKLSAEASMPRAAETAVPASRALEPQVRMSSISSSSGVSGRPSAGVSPSLAVRAPKRMRQGKRARILVAFEDDRDLYETVHYSVLFQGAEVASASTNGRPGRCRTETSIIITPSASGEVDFRVEAACSLPGGETETYGIGLYVLVDEMAAGHSIVINQGGNTQAGKNEVNISGLDVLNGTDNAAYLCENAAWKTGFELCRSPRRISLETIDGAPESLQLLSDREVSFGRNRPPENDVVLRVMGPDGLLERPRHCSVSGKHFKMFFDERGCCRLEDPSSTNGTRVDGERVQCSTFQPGRESLLSIGCPEMELRMKVKAFRRSAYGATDGVLVERLDSARERIAMVLREVDFDDGSAVFWNGRTWAARSSSGAMVPLAFSTEVELDGRKYVVQPFSQEEFIHPTGRFCRRT